MPSGHRRATRATVLGAVLLLCATACAEGPDPVLVGAEIAPPTVTYEIPDDLALHLLPTSGAQTRWVQGVDAFQQQVTRARTLECARSHGLTPPAQAPPAFIRLGELPDLEFIRQHGMAGSPEPPGTPVTLPTTTGTTPPGTSDPGAAKQCRDEGLAAGRELTSVYQSLQARWMSAAVAVRDDPRARQALQALPGCAVEKGVKISSEDDFFRHLDRAVQQAPDEVSAARADLALSAVYAECMLPVEKIREPLREAARHAFLTENAREMEALRLNLIPRIHALEHRYGLRISFPQPSPHPAAP